VKRGTMMYRRADPAGITLADVANRALDLLTLVARTSLHYAATLDLDWSYDAEFVIRQVLSYPPSPGQLVDTLVRVLPTENSSPVAFSTSKQLMALSRSIAAQRAVVSSDGPGLTLAMEAISSARAAWDVAAPSSPDGPAPSADDVDVDAAVTDAAYEDDAMLVPEEADGPAYGIPAPNIAVLHLRLEVGADPALLRPGAVLPPWSPFLNDPFFVLRNLEKTFKQLSERDGGTAMADLRHQQSEVAERLKWLAALRDGLSHHTTLLRGTSYLTRQAVTTMLRDVAFVVVALDSTLLPEPLRAAVGAAGAAVGGNAAAAGSGAASLPRPAAVHLKPYASAAEATAALSAARRAHSAAQAARRLWDDFHTSFGVVPPVGAINGRTAWRAYTDTLREMLALWDAREDGCAIPRVVELAGGLVAGLRAGGADAGTSAGAGPSGSPLAPPLPADETDLLAAKLAGLVTSADNARRRRSRGGSLMGQPHGAGAGAFGSGAGAFGALADDSDDDE
jgi:hypothetical protein